MKKQRWLQKENSQNTLPLKYDNHFFLSRFLASYRLATAAKHFAPNSAMHHLFLFLILVINVSYKKAARIQDLLAKVVWSAKNTRGKPLSKLCIHIKLFLALFSGVTVTWVRGTQIKKIFPKVVWNTKYLGNFETACAELNSVWCCRQQGSAQYLLGLYSSRLLITILSQYIF